MKTAVLIKDRLIGLISYRWCCKSCEAFVTVAIDSAGTRKEAVQANAMDARANFRISIDQNVRDGWRLIYVGPPNQG